jgi:hypothetical protein
MRTTTPGARTRRAESVHSVHVQWRMDVIDIDGDPSALGSVTVDPVKAKAPGSVGDLGWVDPVTDITCVFTTQLLPSSTHPVRSQLKQLVHQALVD